MKVDYEKLLEMCIKSGLQQGMLECMSHEDMQDEKFLTIVTQKILDEINKFVELK